MRKSLNDVNLEQVRLACDNKRDRALIEFTYSTGLRVSELVKLDINDLDFTSNKLSVVGKGNKERNVMFSDIAKFYLEQYLNERKDYNTALFVGIKKPYNRMSKRAIEKRFEKIKEKLNVKKLYPHLLRHTFATKLASTADITVVQKLLGHTNINTTMLYAEVNEDKISYQYKASKL